jgi:hypothetical protein
VDLYGPDGQVRAGCKVTDFGWLNRGLPHFTYYQRESPSEEPGCGDAWAYAGLDCSTAPNEPRFALPAGTRAPTFYPRGNGPSPEVLAAQKRALREAPAFEELRSAGALHAQEKQEQLHEEVKVHSFSHGERHVLLTVGRIYTGEGQSACGSDFTGQLTRAVVLGPQGERLLEVGELDGDQVVGVMDLEGDGRLELLMRESSPLDWVGLVREDGTVLVGAEVENCDCGC